MSILKSISTYISKHRQSRGWDVLERSCFNCTFFGDACFKSQCVAASGTSCKTKIRKYEVIAFNPRRCVCDFHLYADWAIQWNEVIEAQNLLENLGDE